MPFIPRWSCGASYHRTEHESVVPRPLRSPSSSRRRENAARRRRRRRVKSSEWEAPAIGGTAAAGEIKQMMITSRRRPWTSLVEEVDGMG